MLFQIGTAWFACHNILNCRIKANEIFMLRRVILFNWHGACLILNCCPGPVYAFTGLSVWKCLLTPPRTHLLLFEWCVYGFEGVQIPPKTAVQSSDYCWCAVLLALRGCKSLLTPPSIHRKTITSHTSVCLNWYDQFFVLIVLLSLVVICWGEFSASKCQQTMIVKRRDLCLLTFRSWKSIFTTY